MHYYIHFSFIMYSSCQHLIMSTKHDICKSEGEKTAFTSVASYVKQTVFQGRWMKTTEREIVSTFSTLGVDTWWKCITGIVTWKLACWDIFLFNNFVYNHLFGIHSAFCLPCCRSLLLLLLLHRRNQTAGFGVLFCRSNCLWSQIWEYQ